MINKDQGINTETALSAAALAGAEAFLPVLSVDDTGKQLRYYGGDQSWFKTRVGVYSGCGAVAAADIFAYLALKDPALSGLLQHGADPMTVECFLEHMNAVIRHVPPGKIPFVDMPYSGLTSLPRFTRYCEAFARSRGVPLKGHYHSNRHTTTAQAAGLIAQQLSKDNPVALLIMQNRKVKSVPYTDVYGNASHTDLRFHWIVITAIEQKADGILITASSEGAKVVVNFDDAWTADSDSVVGWRGIVYFYAEQMAAL